LGRVQCRLQEGIYCHYASNSVPEANVGKTFHFLDPELRGD
jgi:hypothetical protein